MHGPTHNKFMDMSFPLQDLSDTIIIKSGNRYLLIEFEETLFLQGCGSYTWIYTRESDNPVLISKSLKTALMQFPRSDFLRCHWSYVINHKIAHSFDSRKKLIIIDKYQIPISRWRSGFIFQFLLEHGIKDINYARH